MMYFIIRTTLQIIYFNGCFISKLVQSDSYNEIMPLLPIEMMCLNSGKRSVAHRQNYRGTNSQMD